MKRIPFITIKKQHIFIALLLAIMLVFISFTPSVVQSLSPKTKYTVVIDAGHGGFDVK